MSHRHVELFLGRLATDRELRWAFLAFPAATFEAWKGEGHELGAVETDALAAIDWNALERFAESLDARRLGNAGSKVPGGGA